MSSAGCPITGPVGIEADPLTCVHNSNIEVYTDSISVVKETRSEGNVSSLLFILQGSWVILTSVNSLRIAYLGGRGRGGGLGDLDVLHLDGVLGEGLRVVQLAHVHSGLLGLVRGGGLREANTNPF